MNILHKILVTSNLPFNNFELFGKEFEFIINKGKKFSSQELTEKVKGINGLICTLRNRIDSNIMDSAGDNLKVISNYAVGYDNIDIEAASKRNIFVTNTPDVLTETTADLAWALIMSISRRIVEAHNFILEGKWKDWHPLFFTGHDIHKKTLGIIGMGRIGTAIARRAKGFNMNVIYNNRSRKPNLEKSLKVKFEKLNALLQKADFIILSVSLNETTKNLIGKDEFDLIKESAYIINISRGSVIHEKSLISALKNNQIAGAGLDVFYNEPINLDNPLLKLKNVVLTPHIGSASIETRNVMAKLAFENLFYIFKEQFNNAHIVNSELIG